MGKVYLLFKTDDFERNIVAEHESLEAVTEYLGNNYDHIEPERLGQGWEIDLLAYDDTGKADLTIINKHKKELEKCSQADIKEGDFYNIAYRIKGVQGSRRIDNTRRICKTKCIKACPPDFIFDNRKAAGMHLHYNDIIVIAKCRVNEDSDDQDRFIYYSNLYQWKTEQNNNGNKDSVKQ